MPIDIALKPVETLLYRSDVAAIGSFRCPASHPLFHNSGPCSSHTFVFPRTATKIRHDRGAPFVGSPDCATLYNRHQLYSRTAIAAEDASDWYVLADDVLVDAIGRRDGERPFRSTHVPVDTATYLVQRQLFDALTGGHAIDPLCVDETVIRIFKRVVAQGRESRSCARAVETAKSLVAATWTENVPLRAIAAAAGTSPYQLCRDFRNITGKTLTEFKHSLRLRGALERLRDRHADLSTLAADLGYSSHSHFSAVFRRHFRITPSQYRDSAA